MPRPGRDTALYHVKCAEQNIDKVLGHLLVIHALYNDGQDGQGGERVINPDTGLCTILPKYPEQTKYVEILSALFIQAQEALKNFRCEIM